MKLLVPGGGGFLGYHVVAEALELGDEVSAFDREGEAPLPGVEALQGDRQGDLSALRGRSWDAVLDTFTYNVVGPGRDVPIAEVLDASRLAADEEAGDQAEPVQTTWAVEEFLEDQLREVPEEERPLWFPEDQIPFERVGSSKALAFGLAFRPVYETARDTLAWVRSRPAGPDLHAGFSADFEREILRRWHVGRY